MPESQPQPDILIILTFMTRKQSVIAPVAEYLYKYFEDAQSKAIAEQHFDDFLTME